MTGKSPSKSAGGDYTVGYGKPPVEHRIKPGEKRNPYGRAGKKAALSPIVFNTLKVEGADEPFHRLVREEAYRMVRVKDGNGMKEMPAAQAMLRQLSNLGLSGNRLAIVNYFNYVKFFEAHAAAVQQECLERILNARAESYAIISQAEKQGIAPPQIYPHPDDYDIDPRTGDWRIIGPRSAQERALYDDLVELRDQALKKLLEEREVDQGPMSDLEREEYSRYLDQFWESIARINAMLPPSLRVSLPERAVTSA